MWHNRLGHPNSHVMQIVLKQCKIPVSNRVDCHFCLTCCAGKSHRLPSHIFNSVYSSLEVSFTDLWGPAHLTSHARYIYYVSFVDAYSRYLWLFPIKSKNETFTIFQFKTMVQRTTSFQNQKSSVWLGWSCHPFTNFLVHHAIVHRLIYHLCLLVLVHLLLN